MPWTKRCIRGIIRNVLKYVAQIRITFWRQTTTDEYRGQTERWLIFNAAESIYLPLNELLANRPSEWKSLHPGESIKRTGRIRAL